MPATQLRSALGRMSRSVPPAWTVALISLLISAPAGAQTYEIVHAFRNSGQPSSLIRASDGNLYGTTIWGGAHGAGSIYRIDSANNLETLHSFGPHAGGWEPRITLMQSSDGDFYGTSARGGDSDYGFIFKMDPSGVFVTLHSFSGPDGATPMAALIEAADGSFYGTAANGGGGGAGTIFKIDSLGNLTFLHSFDRYVDGGSPYGPLVQVVDGTFYGTTFWGGASDLGTVYKMDSTGGVTTLHSFAGGDGSRPVSALIQATSGDLWGTTSGGGTNGLGTVFVIQTSGDFASVHHFSSADGAYPVALVEGTDGDFYGTTSAGGTHGVGTVFRMTPAGEITTLHSFSGSEGSHPVAPLVLVNDRFYGITRDGGAGRVGTAFEIDDSGNLSTLVSFENLGDAALGELSRFVQASDGYLYATSSGGGDNGAGTVLRMNSCGDLRILHSFAGDEGSGPYSALVEATDGKLYGTARNGGAHGFGTTFAIDLLGTFQTLHHFSDADGSYPEAALMESADGNFYGTTTAGGEHGWGVVFKMNPAGHVSILHSFDGTGGATPRAAVIEASDGNLYGTTDGGGESDGGTVFVAARSGGASILHSFTSIEEAHPRAALIQASDGNLYGTTAYVDGTIFRINAIGDFETLHYFRRDDEGDGSSPYDGLVQAADGNLYGTTFLGGAVGQYAHQGTVFRADFSGSVTILHSFNRFDGNNPTVGVIEASDGDIYGSAAGGPFAGQNVIFRLSKAEVASNQLVPTSGPASGGSTLDLVGGGFVQGATVMVGDVPGTDVMIPDPTFIYFSAPALSPGTLNDVSVTNQDSRPSSATLPKAYLADFLDVPQTDPFHDVVEKIFRKGITAGCAAGNYCPDDSVTRAQMAVLLLKSRHGSTYVPPPCAGVFPDVACPSMFADWIEQLAAEGITGGCGGGNYCPDAPVTRAQMAVFLLKTKHGAAYQPPDCAGIFGDVACPSLFANWIEQLAAEKITAGCGGGDYCPGNPNTRGQMAAFIVKTFGL